MSTWYLCMTFVCIPPVMVVAAVIYFSQDDRLEFWPMAQCQAFYVLYWHLTNMFAWSCVVVSHDGVMSWEPLLYNWPVVFWMQFACLIFLTTAQQFCWAVVRKIRQANCTLELHGNHKNVKPFSASPISMYMYITRIWSSLCRQMSKLVAISRHIANWKVKYVVFQILQAFNDSVTLLWTMWRLPKWLPKSH